MKFLLLMKGQLTKSNWTEVKAKPVTWNKEKKLMIKIVKDFFNRHLDEDYPKILVDYKVK